MKSFFRNHEEELMQRTAWRTVRSAEDRFGAGRGREKLEWCIKRLSDIFPKSNREDIEDHARAAYVNFSIEHSAVERKF